MSLLELNSICKSYGKNLILDRVSLSLEAGQTISLLGTSGSGKSTLLNVLGGMDKATSGRVFFNSSDISKYNDKQLTFFRR